MMQWMTMTDVMNDNEWCNFNIVNQGNFDLKFLFFQCLHICPRDIFIFIDIKSWMINFSIWNFAEI